MRIALAVPGGVDRSGTDRVIPCLLWIIEELVRAGHEVRVFASRQEPTPGEWGLLGARVRNFGGRRASLALLRALIVEHREAPFDAMHVFWAGTAGVAAGIAGKLLGVPVVLTIAGGELEAQHDIAYGGRLTRLGRIAAWLSMRLATHVTAPSAYLCAQAARLGVDASHVPLGVALDRWPVRTPQPRDLSAPMRLLHVASLNRVKDQRTLLLAARSLARMRQPFELVIIGEDTLRGEIQQLAAHLGVTALVTFAGFLPHSRLRQWVERADLLIVTSRHEAGPLVTLEAAIAGVPTVGTAVGHIADFSPAGAVATAIGDHKAIALAVRSLARDEKARRSIAGIAQERALAWDVKRTVRHFISLYENNSREAPTGY